VTELWPVLVLRFCSFLLLESVLTLHAMEFEGDDWRPTGEHKGNNVEKFL
jgi:hypothetical protein